MSTTLTPADIETLEYMARDDAQIEGSDDFALCTTSRIVKFVSEYSVERLQFGGYIKELDRLGTWVIYDITEAGRALVNSDDDTELIALVNAPLVDQPSFPHTPEFARYLIAECGPIHVDKAKATVRYAMQYKVGIRLARAAINHILEEQ